MILGWLLALSMHFAQAVQLDCASILEGHAAIASGRAYAISDLQLRPDELSRLAQIKIRASENYDRFGDLHLMASELPSYLLRIGVDDPALQSLIVEVAERVTRDVLKAQGQTAWVTFRAFKASDAYDLPRWHTDGRFFASTEMQAKFATVLLGPATLFNSAEGKLREAFLQLQRRQIDRADLRKELAALLAGVPVDQPSFGQGAWFVVGDKNSAIHSEPPMGGDRLFFSVVPGTPEQIEELKKRWGR